MASTSEVGHAKNVANLQKLIQRVTTYTLYNPPVANIAVANLLSLYTTADAKLDDVENTRAANKIAIYNRQVAFENLKPICTRIINLLDILGLSDGILNQAKSLNKSIQGGTTKSVSPPPPEGNGDGVSTSRQSYTQQAELFGNLLTLIASIPEYVPNEEDLQLPNLNIYQQSLVDITQPVDQTEAELKMKLMERDALLYNDKTGLYDIAQNVKKYVKGIYGGDSPEYFNVSSIQFTNPT